MATGSEISEFGSRSSVSISSMAGEPSGARRHGGQNCALRPNVTSVRRATHWNHSSGVPRRRAVLDSCRFRVEAIGVQGLLQFASKSRRSRRQNTGGTSGGQRLHDLEIVSLAWPLSWALSHANRGLSRNSPGTRANASFSHQNQQLKLVGGCNAIKSRDLKIGDRVRSPPPLPRSTLFKCSWNNLGALLTAPLRLPCAQAAFKLSRHQFQRHHHP